jgi:hypothetical protein
MTVLYWECLGRGRKAAAIGLGIESPELYAITKSFRFIVLMTGAANATASYWRDAGMEVYKSCNKEQSAFGATTSSESVWP